MPDADTESAVTQSKSALVYVQVKRDLQSGVFVPAQRIDPATLARRFRSSPTPVRFALYRLVGEDLLEDQARSGFRVPLPNEVALRELYDWRRRLLACACGQTDAAPSAASSAALDVPVGDVDAAEHTEQLFDSIARSAHHRLLAEAVQRNNDRLAPVRRFERGLLDGALDEYQTLANFWRHRHLSALRTAIDRYHERRMKAVPDIVASLSVAWTISDEVDG